MIKKIKGTITYKVKDNHPDLKYIPEEDRDKVHTFEDTYTIDTDNFWGEDHYTGWIKNDLMLVAGGGYDTDTIREVKIKLQGV